MQILRVCISLIAHAVLLPQATALEEEQCHKHEDLNEVERCNDLGSQTRISCPSKRLVALEEIEASWADEPEKVIFIESAYNASLGPRQSCAIESAARASNGELKLLVVMTAKSLDLSVNATCHIYQMSNVYFRHADPDALFVDTPLEALWKSQAIQNSAHRIVQTSDAMRLVLVSKYGGYYADLDVIFLRGFGHLRNFISGDHVNYKTEPERLRTSVGRQLTNAIFHFDKGHAYVERCLEDFPRGYNPSVCFSGGPHLMSRVLLRQMCDYQLETIDDINPDRFPADQCEGVHVLPAVHFYKYGSVLALDLFVQRKDSAQWADIFQDVRGIHLINSSDLTRRLKFYHPEKYGKDVPGVVYLAHNYCPVAFRSRKYF